LRVEKAPPNKDWATRRVSEGISLNLTIPQGIFTKRRDPRKKRGESLYSKGDSLERLIAEALLMTFR